MAIKFNGNDISAHKLDDKKYIIIGDSYGRGSTGDGNYITSWVEYLRQRLGVATSNWTTNCVSGKGFGAGFLDQLSSIADNKEITDIIVGGGMNDRDLTYDEIYSAISTFQTYAKTHFPNAELKIAFIAGTNSPTYRYAVYKCLARYQKACGVLGIPMLGGCEFALREYDTCMSADGVHPNAHGYKMIAQYVYNALMGYGNTCCIESTSTEIEAAGNVTAITEAYFAATVKDSILHFASPGKLKFTLDALNVGNASGGANYIHLANITSGLIRGSMHDMCVVDVNTLIKDNGAYYNVPCRLSIINNQLLLYPFATPSSGTGYLSLSAVTEVQIAKFSSTFNSLMC